MNKIKVFLSSRVNSSFRGLDEAYSLKDLRQYISDSLEQQKFLGEKIIDVIKNEDNFNADLSKTAFDNCLHLMRDCNIIIILYNGEAGWAITDYSANGICHEEFLIAANEFSEMSYMIDLSQYFNLPESGPEKTRNDQFSKEITDAFAHAERIQAETVADLKEKVVKQVKKYILNAVQKSIETQKQQVASSSVFGQTLDWSKLNYDERQEAMTGILKAVTEDIPSLNKVLKAMHAIPDNMSVADARNRIGRPFVNEYELLAGKKGDSGILHFIAVYGNATEVQVKNLVGFPDVTVIRSSFGYYLWEQRTHIQIFFFVKCINPQTIRTRISELINWLNSSKEISRILVRAKARYGILKAIDHSQKLEGLK